MRKSMQKKIFLVFVTLIIIGVLMTGTISITLTKVLVPEINGADKIKEDLIKYQIMSMGIGLTVSLLLGYRYIRKVTDPIRQLSQITKKISRGDYFGQRIYPKTEDELDELSQNFNLMSERLETTINELRENSSKMEAVLRSMSNGVIAIDNSRRLLIANPKVREIFGISAVDPIGKHIKEVFRNEDLNSAIEQLSPQNDSVRTEVELNSPSHKICSVNCGFMKHSTDPNRITGVVVIVQDITEIRKLENMRRDFVANVSHELKTPLTSIKGFVETLKDGAIENVETRNRFLNIIDIEADRLSFLIKDLLTLSEIESGIEEEGAEALEVESTTREILSLLNEAAKKKNISVKLEIEGDVEVLKGSKSLLQQMMINLVDNAIKYTSEGGEVVVKIFKDEVNLNIVVKDTGIGIPPEHIDRLFERFYRVDKARSRQVGGTGLGLAIVKHIVLSFKGNIKVNSKVDRGSEFIVQIPYKNK
ncbi:alkaline phosphatase synthesis sensor protein PhoR [Andreesenia angusta]|uniref:histidine kinase n=2 Tax=Andreesenia angusta TaxID=39480 RepID=A0A1S1V8S7_9FIRM|nr:alkaline phosphatase synthesis sensor protein PhoR [Andreesenia angusta]